MSQGRFSHSVRHCWAIARQLHVLLTQPHKCMENHLTVHQTEQVMTLVRGETMVKHFCVLAPKLRNRKFLIHQAEESFCCWTPPRIIVKIWVRVITWSNNAENEWMNMPRQVPISVNVTSCSAYPWGPTAICHPNIKQEIFRCSWQG